MVTPTTTESTSGKGGMSAKRDKGNPQKANAPQLLSLFLPHVIRIRNELRTQDGPLNKIIIYARNVIIRTPWGLWQ